MGDREWKGGNERMNRWSGGLHILVRWMDERKDISARRAGGMDVVMVQSRVYIYVISYHIISCLGSCVVLCWVVM
jgi:hypothetical protein